MDVKSMSTEDLDRLLHELLAAELKSREPEPTPEQLRAAWVHYMRIYYREPVEDPSTGVMLQPSCHGKDCPGNGEHPGVECCCDECDYYLDCFPDWATNLSI